MSRRSHVIVHDEEDVAVAASDREGTFVNEDEDDDEKSDKKTVAGGKSKSKDTDSDDEGEEEEGEKEDEEDEDLATVLWDQVDFRMKFFQMLLF